MRKIVIVLLAFALALNLAFPEQAHAAMSTVPSDWTQSGDVIYKTVSNGAGVDRVEFSNWDRIGENNVQFSTNLTIENAEVTIEGPGFERATVDNEQQYDCIVIPKKSMTRDELAQSVLRLRWADGAYLQDGTPCSVVVTLTNYRLAVGTPNRLDGPLSILRTVPSQTIEIQAFYNARSGGTGVTCDVNVQIGIPEDATSKPESMVFTATDLDIADSGDYEGTYAESVRMRSGVLGTVYLQNNVYGDFTQSNASNRPLYGTDPNGRFLNLERIASSDGTWFSSTRQTSDEAQSRAAGFATLVNASDPGFDFAWSGNNCGTTLFMQAGASPQLTVGNVGAHPTRLTTTDEQFAQRGQDGLAAGLYVNPTNASRMRHTYEVHWKSQKTITAQADPGYRVSQVYVDPQINAETGGIESEPIDVADLAVGQSVTVGASTVTRNADGTVTVQVADNNPTGVGDATCFMNDHVVLFAATIDTTSVSVTKRWEGGQAHSATVELLQNGEPFAAAELTAAGGWTHTFEALPQADEQGGLYTYTVREHEMPGFVPQVTGDAATGFVITNVADTTSTVDVTGAKTWNDAGFEDQRPHSITVRLHANGRDTGHTQVVTADTGWTWSFVGMPKYEAGTQIVYTVTEDAVRDYTTTYQDNQVINTYSPETTSLTVSKEWLYADGLPMDNTTDLAPVTVQLVSRPAGSGAEFAPVDGQTIELTADGAWRGTFEALPVRDGDAELEYAVQETPVAGYTSSVTGDMASGFVITNTQTPPDVPFIKVAEDTQDVLLGALLMLTGPNGVQVSTWVSTSEPHVLSLTPGVYHLNELAAPEGYMQAEPLEVAVASDGSITVGGAAAGEVRMVDPLVSVVPPTPDPDPDPGPGGGGEGEPEPEDADPITPFHKETWGEQGDPQYQDATDMFESVEEIVSIDLIDPNTNEPATGPIDALDEDGNVVGTYEIDENDLVTFTPNADFVGTAVPAILRGTNADGATADARYTPNVRPDTGTTTTTTRTVYTPNTGTTTTTSIGGSTPATADATNSWAAVLFVIAAMGVLGGALALRKRR